MKCSGQRCPPATAVIVDIRREAACPYPALPVTCPVSRWCRGLSCVSGERCMCASSLSPLLSLCPCLTPHSGSPLYPGHSYCHCSSARPTPMILPPIHPSFQPAHPSYYPSIYLPSFLSPFITPPSTVSYHSPSIIHSSSTIYPSTLSLLLSIP